MSKQPFYTDCQNCGSADHNNYACPCACHDRKRTTRYGIYVPDINTSMGRWQQMLSGDGVAWWPTIEEATKAMRVFYAGTSNLSLPEGKRPYVAFIPPEVR